MRVVGVDAATGAGPTKELVELAGGNKEGNVDTGAADVEPEEEAAAAAARRGGVVDGGVPLVPVLISVSSSSSGARRAALIRRNKTHLQMHARIGFAPQVVVGLREEYGKSESGLLR